MNPTVVGATYEVLRRHPLLGRIHAASPGDQVRLTDGLPLTWMLLVVGLRPCGFLVKVAGDAARYLHVAPPNIQIRHRIREAGIKLLENLHRSGKYDRIVVVGHSLGSVIGYDVLTHLWARWHDHFTAPSNHQPQLEVIEELARSAAKGEAFARRYQAAQLAYFKELREAGHPWLISDFVTLGSPLAHAPFLMARGTEAFKTKLGQREFPTCPPVLESFTQPAADSGKGKSKIDRLSYEAGFQSRLEGLSRAPEARSVYLTL